MTSEPDGGSSPDEALNQIANLLADWLASYPAGDRDVMLAKFTATVRDMAAGLATDAGEAGLREVMAAADQHDASYDLHPGSPVDGWRGGIEFHVEDVFETYDLAHKDRNRALAWIAGKRRMAGLPSEIVAMLDAAEKQINDFAAGT
jgi:hypothetical protein